MRKIFDFIVLTLLVAILYCVFVSSVSAQPLVLRQNLYGGYTFRQNGIIIGDSRRGLGNTYHYYNSQRKYRGYDRTNTGRFYTPNFKK